MQIDSETPQSLRSFGVTFLGNLLVALGCGPARAWGLLIINPSQEPAAGDQIPVEETEETCVSLYL